MSKKFLIFLILLGLSVPLFVSAQGILSGPIVPCGREGQDPCTLCDIFKMAQKIISFIGAGIFAIAIIFIAVGGVIILASSGSPEKMGQGRAMITNAIIGIIVALLSWVIINEVLIAVAGSVSGQGQIRFFNWPWNEIRCVGGEPTEGGGTGGGGTADRCSQMSSAGYCFNNNYYCLAGVRDQVSDATPELVSLLNCMAPRLPSGNARDISSISDNSGGRCFSNWNSQCPVGTDSCGGTCCGHGQNSLHYGGAGCRGFSYAVDFAMESACSIIRSAANSCGTNLGLGDIDTICESDHVHVELDGLARSRSCI